MRLYGLSLASLQVETTSESVMCSAPLWSFVQRFAGVLPKSASAEVVFFLLWHECFVCFVLPSLDTDANILSDSVYVSRPSGVLPLFSANYRCFDTY